MYQELRVYRNDAISLEEIEAMMPSAIILSPGPCTPNEAGICLDVVASFSGRFPILGVCLGHQVIGQAFGAEVVRADRLMHGKTSLIYHDGRTIFRGLQNPFEATRYHSLILRRESLPDCLEVTAETEMGEVMGVRHRQLFVEGVQFHPESILTAEGKKLLRNFLALVAEHWRSEKGGETSLVHRREKGLFVSRGVANIDY
ncbi:MAG: anthranilate synthase component II [Thermacetogeniaceae bacterium]